MAKIMIAGKEGVEIFGASVKTLPKNDAYLVYWNGIEFFVPKSVSRKNNDGTFFVQKWFFDKKMNENIS